MSDFHYEIEATNHYFFENFTVYGKAVQNGTPTPETPVSIEVVSDISLQASDTIIPIDLQGNIIASLPDGTRDVLTIDATGHCVLTKNVDYVSSSSENTWSTSASTNNAGMRYIATNVDVVAPITYENNTRYCYSSVPLTNNNFAATTVTGFGVNSVVGGTKRVYWRFYPNDDTYSVDLGLQIMESMGAVIYYPLATPITIDLGYIDVSTLQDIETEIPISLISSIETDTTYSYTYETTYEVLNSYENYNAPKYAYPPNHMGQEWETFDANDWNKDEMLDYTGQFESHAVYTVELCELMQSGVFNWSRPELDWSEAAYSTEQYERFCNYFEQRFMFREISMLPPLQWFTAFKRMMVYELMPKYKPLYAQVANGISPLGENEYYKERHVSSAYPETLLSGNSDYISSGEDREFERIKIDNVAEALETYRNGFRSVDAALGDELEVLFISMYTSYVNGL